MQFFINTHYKVLRHGTSPEAAARALQPLPPELLALPCERGTRVCLRAFNTLPMHTQKRCAMGPRQKRLLVRFGHSFPTLLPFLASGTRVPSRCMQVLVNACSEAPGCAQGACLLGYLPRYNCLSHISVAAGGVLWGERAPGYETYSSLAVSLCTLTWCQRFRPALISTMGFVYPFLLQSNDEQSSFSPGCTSAFSVTAFLQPKILTLG